MKLLDRYIGVTVLQSVGVVMVVLLALFAFATFAGELEKVGRGSYDALAAGIYSLLLMPRLAYQLFPIVVLIGSIIGLGMMASNSELVVIRGAGVSLRRIIWSVMRVGLLLMVSMVVVGEYVAPIAESKAQSLKAEALQERVSFRSDTGLWARDGNRFIHIQNLMSPHSVGRVSVYEFDDQNRLTVMAKARTAEFDDKGWTLNQLTQSQISTKGITTERKPQEHWDSLLEPEIMGVVTVKPDYLSFIGLYRYIGYLQENGLDAGRYQLALWRKIISPLVTLVMILVAVPFVFGSLRSTGIGQRIFVGTLVGIGFYMADQALGQMGLVYGLPPALGVFVAPLAFLGGALYMISRIR